MLERMNQYRPILWVLIIFSGLMAAAAYTYDRTVFFIGMIAWAIVALGAVLWSWRITHRNKQRLNELCSSLEHIMSDAVIALPMPSLIVRPSGEIVWSNAAAKQSVFPGKELFGHNLEEFLPGFDWQAASTPEGRDVEIASHHYSAFLMHSSSTREPLTIISLVDDHDLKHYTQEYFDSRPYVLTMLIDNYAELFTDAKENERSRTMGQIEHIIETFAEENHGMVKKLERDRYLAVIEERYIKKIVANRFPILDAIRTVDTGDRNNATLSIGVGTREGSLHEGEEISRQALDMALGRGGDQVALRQKNGYEFFGGTGRGVEKRNKVRTRIMANAITEVARTCDNILIMGHRFADLDCLGAAIGLSAGLRLLGKPCHIVINAEKSPAQPLYDAILAADPTYEDVFYTPYRAIESVTKNTLLLIVDTHIPGMLESRELYEACRNVVVIDHHRKMVEHIDNAIIFFHEPYASSASEMVAELVQYFGDGKRRITVAEAEAMLSGIMLDTKNFTLHTGVRTFEAAAFLRRMGADTVAVRRLFASSMESYQERSRLVAAAEVYRSCAISCTASGGDVRVVAAQAADDLLGISGVDASFVLCEQDGTVNISGRSMGGINVQIILEGMGGGGHQTMAGAQLRDITLEACRQRLLAAIDQYYEEHSKGGSER